MRLRTSIIALSLALAAVAGVCSLSRAARADPAVVVITPPPPPVSTSAPIATSDEPRSSPVVVVAAPPEDPPCGRRRSDAQPGIGAVLDGGKGPLSYGLRVMNDQRDHFACGDSRTVGAVGFGLEVRGEGTSAVDGQGVLRVHGGDDGPWAAGFTVEGALGAATDGTKSIATGSTALLFDLGAMSVGASYQFPIGADRPAWLGTLGLALRVNVPLMTTDVRHDSRDERR